MRRAWWQIEEKKRIWRKNQSKNIDNFRLDKEINKNSIFELHQIFFSSFFSHLFAVTCAQLSVFAYFFLNTHKHRTYII